MLPENHIVLDPNDVVGVILIEFLQMHQYLKLNTCLVLEALFVSNQFDGNTLLGFMVKALNGLTETTLTKEFNNFEPVSDVILHDNFVISSLIIITKVIWLHRRASYLLRANT